MDQLVFIEIIVTTLYIVNIFCVVAIVFFERKEPSATVVWLLLMTYLPGVGVLLYLFFGRGIKISIIKKLRVKQELEQKYRSLSRKEKEKLEAFLPESLDQMPEKNAQAQKYKDLIRMHYNMSASQYSQDNTLEIYTTAQEKYDNLFQDIRNAEKSINLLYFIIKNDNSGRELIRLLSEKAAQGVTVRLLYDDIGSFFTPIYLFRPLKKAGGKVRKFFPLRLGSIFRANYRNHRKIVVIDGKTGYLGGMNIGDDYLGLHKKKTPWRDTHMRIRGTAVLTLQLRFFMDWFYATEDNKELLDNLTSENFSRKAVQGTGSTGVQIVSSGPDLPGEEIKLGIIKMVNSAEKYIYIQTPYLMPDTPVLEALYIAAASGVDVKVMLPGVPDKKMVYAVTYSYMENLLNKDIQVYIHKGFLHAKTVVVDGQIATIGTTNFDIRSFSLHFEANAFIYDEEVSQECAEIFEKDLLDCREMTMEEYSRRSIFQKFAEGILRLFAPLM